MQSDDEIAFVLSHEMSHHIAGHIPKQQQQQVLGALILGGLVAAAGNPNGGPASDQAIQPGHGHRRLRRRPQLLADLRARGRHARRLHRRPRRLRPRARRADLPPPGAGQPRRPAASSPATRAPRSARPPSPASPPRSAASRPWASSRAPARPAEAGHASHISIRVPCPAKIAERAFSGLRVAAAPPRYPVTAADGAGWLAAPRKNRAARCGTRPSKDADRRCCPALFDRLR